MKVNGLKLLCQGEKLSLGAQILLMIQLSVPAILAQTSSIVMQYIDSAMVGALPNMESASIGLVSSTTWLFGGLASACAVGFTVQVAHRIGEGKEDEARLIVRLGLFVTFCFSMLLMAVGMAISSYLPIWLKGEEAICPNATLYFFTYVSFIPFMQMNYVCSGMLQCSGNIRLPSILNIAMCFLDVVFNFFLIFPMRQINVFGWQFTMWGAGLGIQGAALGTGLAEVTVGVLLMYFLLLRSPSLKLRRGERLVFSKERLKRAFKISMPIGVEQCIMCGAQIVSTTIVAPLGGIAIAAHSFAITAESLCYMPGYGIGTASTTIVGQLVGANQKQQAKRMGWMTIALGVGMMSITAVLMYIIAPYIMAGLSPIPEIQKLGAEVLRIEVFAEPMYAASIVATGVFRGTGKTLVPSCMNFCSMWLVRLPLSALLVPSYGLHGVWIAMCIELCVRGMLLLAYMIWGKWNKEENTATKVS